MKMILDTIVIAVALFEVLISHTTVIFPFLVGYFGFDVVKDHWFTFKAYKAKKQAQKETERNKYINSFMDMIK